MKNIKSLPVSKSAMHTKQACKYAQWFKANIVREQRATDVIAERLETLH